MFGSVFSKRVLTTDAALGIIVTIIRNKTRGKERNVFMTETNEELLLRAKRALANGEFSRADAFCEVILDADPNCAEAYLYKLLAELSLSSREALAEYRHFYDKSENYKKAFRLGDRALRDELLAPLNATFALLEEQKRETTYLSAEKALAEAKLPAACEAAEKLFRSLGDYRDSLERAEACRKRAEEIARAMKQKAEEEAAQRAAKKKARLRLALYFVGAFFAAVLIFLAVYFFIVRTAVPNGMREDALDLIEEGRYEDALLLLDEAREKAVFDGTREKIDDAKKEIDKREASLAFEKTLMDTVGSNGVNVTDAGLRFAISKLLEQGVTLEIAYEMNGGTLYRQTERLDETVFSYPKGEKLPELLTAQKDGYRFLYFTLDRNSPKYRVGEGVYAVTLCAKYDENDYVITYDLGGAVAENPNGYGPDTETFSLQAPIRRGYTFVGWTGTEIDTPTLHVTVEKGSQGDRAYKAHYKANSYTVALDASGGVGVSDSITVAYDSALALPVPTRNGFCFLGWYNGGVRVEGDKWQYDTNLSLTAKWEPITYTIQYDLGGVRASNPNAKYYKTTESVALEALAYPHTRFVGWYEDKNFQTPIHTIPTGTTGEKTLYAKWEFDSITVTYDLNGGSLSEPLTRTYTVLDFPLVHPRPTLSGYSFYYWAYGEEDGVPITQIEEFKDTVLVANYLPDGTELTPLAGGSREGMWCCVTYTGKLTSVKFPKYHRMSRPPAGLSPYIQEIEIDSSCRVEELSISDEVRMVEGYWGSVSYTVYENGRYLGARGNKYHLLVNRVNASAPMTVIHEETRVIGEAAFYNDVTLKTIVIPQSVVEIGLSAFRGCESLKTVYNLSALSIQQGSTANGYVAYYADAVHTSLDGKKDE